MKIQPAIGLVALQIALLALPVRRPSDVAAAQNPLASLENAAREKAAEEALTKVLNDNLPLTLNAKDVYPTVTTLPGGPFSPKPLQLTADQLDQPLSPGDYTINTLDFCSQYSVHQPGAGLAYVLGPYEGKAAGAIGALIWRGTEQYNINPNSLQAVSWAIQSGLTYDQMPQSYQAIVDQVIPDLKSEITGDYVTNLENTYNSLAKTASLPPLDTILAKLGAPGQLALDAERQRQILTSQNTSDELKQQTLFQGQESGIYTPVKVENGPWTERVAGQVYMKLLIAGGNMTTTNVMQIRVMPPPATTARNAGGNTKGAPHLVRAAFREPQITAVPVLAAAITVAYLMEGIIGYPQGQGAQALGQVAVAAPSAPQAPPAPPSLAQAPPAPPAPVPVAPAPAPPATPDTPAPAPTVAANSGNTANPTIKSHFFFASCSGAITSQQLYSAYNSLYSNSPTFKNDMDSIPDQVQVNNTNYNVAVNVLVVDGCSSSPYLGTFYQNLAGFGNSQIMETHPGSGVQPGPVGDYAFTYMPIDSKTNQITGEIKVVISAQNLLYSRYDNDYGVPPSGQSPGTCNVSTNTINEPWSVQQILAYELGQNAVGISHNPGYQLENGKSVPLYPEQPDEPYTNIIMGELAAKKNLLFCKDINGNKVFCNDKIPDPSNECAIMSGSDYCSQARVCALNPGKVINCEMPDRNGNPGPGNVCESISFQGATLCPSRESSNTTSQGTASQSTGSQGTASQGKLLQPKGGVWDFADQKVLGILADPQQADVVDDTGKVVKQRNCYLSTGKKSNPSAQ